MPDMALSIVVTRAELSLGDLELNDHTAYETVGFGPGVRIRRNAYNRSGNVHGGTLNNSVLDVIVRPVAVRVLATSQAQLDARTLTLIAAFEQSAYTIVETKNGQATTYSCMVCEQISPADSSGSAQEDWDKHQLMAYRHAYRIAVPTQPQPTTGPI